MASTVLGVWHDFTHRCIWAYWIAPVAKRSSASRVIRSAAIRALESLSVSADEKLSIALGRNMSIW